MSRRANPHPPEHLPPGWTSDPMAPSAVPMQADGPGVVHVFLPPLDFLALTSTPAGNLSRRWEGLREPVAPSWLEDDLHPDVLGTRDAPGDAWFVTFPVEPEYIEVWDGKRWRPVDEVDTESMQTRALRAGTFERDDLDEDEDEVEDEDPTGYWMFDFDVFAPEAP